MSVKVMSANMLDAGDAVVVNYEVGNLNRPQVDFLLCTFNPGSCCDLPECDLDCLQRVARQCDGERLHDAQDIGHEEGTQLLTKRAFTSAMTSAKALSIGK